MKKKMFVSNSDSKPCIMVSSFLKLSLVPDHETFCLLICTLIVQDSYS